MGQWSLEQSRILKDPGITMNDSLTWKEHVKLRNRKAHKFFHQTKRNTSYLLMVSANINLYKCTLIPFFIYGFNCLMHSKSDMQLLKKSQENVLKWILPSLNYCERLRSLNLLPQLLHCTIANGEKSLCVQHVA